ncbi:copper homeostasis protein CutC, partial [Gordonia sihwensis]|uniref:copper homeostasis protein CutC n=1 Tax=Gordonia sihwensis TaxID=173559 RepID=UPI0005F0392F
STPPPIRSLTVLAGLGVDRVLTSGGAARAGDGLDVLRALVAADTGVEVMAGGGVTAEAFPAIRGTGVHAVHLSAKRSVRDRGVAGPGGGAASDLEMTDAGLVRAATRAAHRP